jgi:hypothetical protein
MPTIDDLFHYVSFRSEFLPLLFLFRPEQVRLILNFEPLCWAPLLLSVELAS